MKATLSRSVSTRRFLIALLAVAAAVGVCCWSSSARAQDGGDRFFGSGFDVERSLYTWLNYVDGESYGAANSHLRVGGTHVTDLNNGVLLLTGQGLLTGPGNGGVSAGVVRRWLVNNCFGHDVVLGAGVHWDMSPTVHENTYHQIVGTLELLMQNWAVRATGYGVLGNDINPIVSGGTRGTGGVFFQGNNLFAGAQAVQIDEVAMSGLEIELAASVGTAFAIPFGADIGNDAAEVFVGYYHLQGDLGPQAHGVKGGVRGYVTPRLAANVTVSNDPVFGTGAYGGFTWFFGGTGGNMPQSIEDKLTIPVQRNYQVAVNQVDTSVNTLVQLTNMGNPITITHVHSGAAGANVGTYEDPFTILPATQGTDIVYVYGNSTYNNQSYVLAPDQRLLGEGDGNQHLVNTDQLGPVILPAGSGGANRPVIQNTLGVALDAATGSEISNLQIANATTAAQLNGLAGNVNVNRTLISGGTTGIDILGGSGTFTFTDVTIEDPTGAGIRVDGGSSNLVFGGPDNPPLGQFGPSVLTQSGGGTAIHIEGGHTGMLTQNASSPIFADSGNGLQFDNADGTYVFNGGITLDGTSNSADTGIDIINGSAGTFTFAGTFADPIEITNDQGVAFNMDSSPGTATLNFFDINQSVGAGIRANNSGTINIYATDIDNTTGDGINVTNTNLDVNFAAIGVGVGIGDDGIEVVNNDGTDRMATILNSNIFPLAGTGIANRGIFINSSGTGTLEANVQFNQIAATNQTILTTSGPTARSLILDLQNSTLDTSTPGVFTEEHVSGGLHSTIVRSWTSPNQVLGSVISGTAGGGILFDRVTFDADANPGNGYQQVQYTGELRIGTVPPQTITRVTGDGLSLINPTGDLSIDTLNIANFNGTGLEVDTKGLGTTFNLVTGGGTIDTLGGPAMYLDPLTGNLSFDNVTSTNSAVLGPTAAQASGNGTGVFVDSLNASGGAGANALTINTLNVTNPVGIGLHIANSTGTFTVGSATIDNSSTSNDAVFLSENTGTVTVNGGTITAGSDGIDVDLDDATPSTFNLNVANTQFNTVDDGIVSDTRGGSTFNATISGITAASNFGDSAIDLDFEDSFGTVTVSNNTVDSGTRETFNLTADMNSDITVDIDNFNVDTNGTGREIIRVRIQDDAQLDLFVDGGTLADNGGGYDGILLNTRDNAQLRAGIGMSTAVTIDDPSDHAIHVLAEDHSRIDLTAQGNTISNVTAGSGFFLENDSTGAPHATICLDADSNSNGAGGPPASGGAGENAFRFDDNGTGGTMGITQATVGALGTDNNGTGAADVTITSGTVTTGASCTLPTP